MSQVISLAILRVSKLGDIARDRAMGVPRGLLKFIVLKMLSEKPMAGAEIVEEIGTQTNGRWKPSPGSIYPLMSWMTKKGFTKELPKNNQQGFKRYSFTSSGRKFFQEQIRLGQDFIRKIEFLLPMLIGGFQLGASQEKFTTLRESARDLLKEYMTLIHNVDDLSSRDVTEINDALTRCLEKLGKVSQKLNHEK